MNIQITNPARSEIFCNLFQHIRLFTDHVNITFKKNNMYLQTMDNSRISIFEIYLPADWFDQYSYNSESDITIGLNATMLFKVLNTRDKQQVLDINFNNNATDIISIHFTSDDKSNFDKHFELSLMELDTDLLAIPEFESNADITLPSTYFAAIISQLQIFGDTIEFKCTEEKIELFSINNESGKMIVDIDIEDLTSYSITENETMNISFSLSRLHNICMYNKLSKDIEIMLTDNYPMKITYNLGLDDANMIFYLAPKIADAD